MAKHVIIGCGPAALSALEAIREINESDEIKLVTRENYLPYSPSVLPYLLAGKIVDSDIWLKNSDYFGHKSIDFLPKREVVSIAPETKEIIYSDNSRDTYDQLLIATGAKPTSPNIIGLDNPHCLHFHTMEHYLQLQDRLNTSGVVAVYGSGLVAIQLVIALIEKGVPIIWIIRNRILRKYVAEWISSLIDDTFRDHGASIYVGSEIREVKKSDQGLMLSLTNGETITADTLVVAAGVEPNIDAFKKSPIKTNKGIVVDRKMMSNVPNIYAAGDVAESLGFLDDELDVSPILPNALEQGKIAGANMAGHQTIYRGRINMNVLRFFGNSLISIGLSTETANGYQVIEEKKEALKQYKKFVYHNNKLVGAMLLNIQIDPGVIRYIIENDLSIKSKEEFNNNTEMVSHHLMLENERKSSLKSYLFQE